MSTSVMVNLNRVQRGIAKFMNPHGYYRCMMPGPPGLEELRDVYELHDKHRASVPDRTKRRHAQMAETREWLATRGKTVYWSPIRAKTLAQALGIMNHYNPGLRYAIYGATAWRGLNHTVCCKGDAVEFSPGIGVDILGPAQPEGTHYHVWVVTDLL